MKSLKGKLIWELTQKEIEYAYHHLQLNNYVYAGLATYHQSCPPAGIRISLKKNRVPEPLYKPATKIAALSEYLNQENPTLVRINYTYLSYFLFEAFRQLDYTDIDSTLDLLAKLAYIPVIAEKNDPFLLWPYPVIRPLTNHVKEKFSILMDSDKIDPLISYKNNEPLQKPDDPAYKVLRYVHHAVSTLLILIENKAEPPSVIKNAFLHAEACMIAYELEHNLREPGDQERNFVSGTQIRSRGTIYLYGGSFFERAHELETAYNWYTKNILYEDFPNDFVYYLTDLKACERLISAYRVCLKPKEKSFLKEFIRKCLFEAFIHAGTFASKMLDYLAVHPDTDLSQHKFRTPDGKILQYAGESVREVYLIALYYQQVVKGIEYRAMDYTTCFRFPKESGKK